MPYIFISDDENFSSSMHCRHNFQCLFAFLSISLHLRQGCWITSNAILNWERIIIFYSGAWASNLFMILFFHTCTSLINWTWCLGSSFTFRRSLSIYFLNKVCDIIKINCSILNLTALTLASETTFCLSVSYAPCVGVPSFSPLALVSLYINSKSSNIGHPLYQNGFTSLFVKKLLSVKRTLISAINKFYNKFIIWWWVKSYVIPLNTKPSILCYCSSLCISVPVKFGLNITEFLKLLVRCPQFLKLVNLLIGPMYIHCISFYPSLQLLTLINVCDQSQAI